VPAHWKTAPLKHVAPSKSSKVNFKPDDCVWHLNLDQIEANTGNIVNKKIAPAGEAGASTFRFDSGNVLYSKLRPYLNKVVSPNECGVATSELVPLRPVQSVLEADFLKYYLRSGAFVRFASQFVSGAKMPRVMMKKFWEHEIPLPPPSEQRHIVELLEHADALRKKRAEADKSADRILPAFFYKMFGDPASNPIGWPMTTLGKIILEKPKYGANASSTEWETGQPRYVRITDVNSDGSLNNKIRGIDLPRWDEYRLEEGDLLIARTGATVGKTYLYRVDDGPCVYAGYMIRFRLDVEQVDPDFVFAFTQTSLYQGWVEANKRLGGQPNINGQEFASLQLFKPDRTLQKKFGDYARGAYKQRLARKSVKNQIDKLYNTLLHQAFTGELTAQWREAHMKELLQEIELQTMELNSREP